MDNDTRLRIFQISQVTNSTFFPFLMGRRTFFIYVRRASFVKESRLDPRVFLVGMGVSKGSQEPQYQTSGPKISTFQTPRYRRTAEAIEA